MGWGKNPKTKQDLDFASMDTTTKGFELLVTIGKQINKLLAL